MRNLLLFWMVIGCAACTDGSKTGTGSVTDNKPIQPPLAEINPAVRSGSIFWPQDSLVRLSITKLDKRFAETPCFAHIDGRNYYIVSSRKWKWSDKINRFGGLIKYGIADDSLNLISDVSFDKIYNPDLTIKDCFEVKRDGKVGLINYRSKEILEPRFEFILSNPDNIGLAYGYTGENWFEIKSQDITLISEVNFDPTLIFEKLNFDVLEIGQSMMYASYAESYDDGPGEGYGVVIVPSFIERFKLLPEEAYFDVILSNQGSTEFGTVAATTETTFRKVISENLVSFFFTLFQQGIDARGYQIESKSVLTYNKESKEIDSKFLNDLTTDDQLCADYGHLFVNDSIVEIKSNKPGNLYSFETYFSYLLVARNGQIQPLTSNRYFDFTKFILINENHFKGCFAISMEGESYDEYNYWRSDHLSIEDLDLMRNEIFAEYGYRFQSEKWSSYFSKMPWYTPLFDNVDDKLTEIDKANIKLILKVKESMQSNEQKFTNRRPITFYAAG